MRIVFMGSAELACPSLDSIAKLASHEIAAVVTQPDRPKGRDPKPAPAPVKLVAERLGLPILQPERIREPAAVEHVRAARPDLIIVVAYGQILPKAVLQIPPLGCVNVHASLLPRWRGAAPIQYAILNGDAETGVTTMFMDERMDTGDIILQRVEPVRPDDTGRTLVDRLAHLGAALLVETVGLIADGTAPRRRQDDAKATYARKLTKEDGRIDWKQPADYIERQIRAFDPWPGTYTQLGETALKLLRAEVVPVGHGQPGEILDNFVIATGNGGLKISELQPAGGRRMDFDAFRRGHAVKPGTILR